jgi:hypothetical protein
LSDGNTTGRVGATPPSRLDVVARNLWRSIGGQPRSGGAEIHKPNTRNALDSMPIGA